jgi:GTPase SAR1 family protein
VKDYDNDTPLNVAAWHGREEIVLAIIKEFGGNVYSRNVSGRTGLHSACVTGEAGVVRCIGKHMSVLVFDNHGNTPLHLCSAKGHFECVEALLSFKAPVLIRNNLGQTSRDVATDSQVLSLLDKYLEKNEHKKLYSAIQKHARKKYSTARHTTRVFVIGNCGAGKSSLVESMKRKGFVKSHQRVSESSVPPHTAGIIPSIWTSKQYGRLLFYDFAGYRVYYSSHAAILENLVSSKKGDNIFIVVIDLRDDGTKMENILYYWLSFIQHQNFEGKRPSLVIAGSHSDLVSNETKEEKSKIFERFCNGIEPGTLNTVAYFLLDCCKPLSRGLLDIQKHIVDLTRESPCYELSRPASIILGLLEKDFSNVTACYVHTIVSHIKDAGIELPELSLYAGLCELHDIGLLFMVGDSTKENLQVILNISELTNKVHQLLFSTTDSTGESSAQFSPFLSGIIPLECLQTMLPKYITKECLIQLQYCQAINYKDVEIFPSIAQTPCNSTNYTFLYFPALCYKGKNNTSPPIALPNHSYSIGWLALCTDNHDYFPPRFLHVLLLRLVSRFSLMSPPSRHQATDTIPDSSYFKRRCTMWKTGVHWSMEEGVKCTVELIDTSEGVNNSVVVITKSIRDWEENCTIIFNKVVSCVMEAKAEFCHSIKPRFYLLNSTEPVNYLNKDNLFDMSEVERVLASPEGTKVQVVSISGKGEMERSKLLFLHNCTCWNGLFPMESGTVLHYLQDEIFRDLPFLAVQLEVPSSVREAISRRDINGERARRDLVRGWMNASQQQPCWWNLVQALKQIDYQVLAEKIQEDHGKFCDNIDALAQS